MDICTAIVEELLEGKAEIAAKKKAEVKCSTCHELITVRKITVILP